MSLTTTSTTTTTHGKRKWQKFGLRGERSTEKESAEQLLLLRLGGLEVEARSEETSKDDSEG